jgi:hypothetical protein
MGYYPAERVIFNQIHFPMLEWLCLIGVVQRSAYPQTRQSLVAAITWDLKTGYLMWCRSTGHSPAKGNGPGLSSSMIEGLWHWLLTWDLLHPRTLACAEWQLQELSDQDRKSACHLNLHRHSSGCPPRKTYDAIILQYWLARRRLTTMWQRSRLPNHTRVRCPSWSYDLIYDIVQVWADSYQ